MVAALTLGCSRTMRFRRTGGGSGSEPAVVDVVTRPRSLYVMLADARFQWTHEMPASKRQLGTVYSATWRR